MGRPMMPRPINPTCMSFSPLGDGWRMAAQCYRSGESLTQAGGGVRTWLFLGLALVWAGTAQAQQAPGPAGAPEGVWRVQIHWVPLDIGGHRYLLYTRVCRPAGEMPARVVVIAHGSPPSPLARPGMKPVSCDSEVARWFLERGFVVVSGMRRGYGETGGSRAGGDGKCSSADYV